MKRDDFEDVLPFLKCRTGDGERPVEGGADAALEPLVEARVQSLRADREARRRLAAEERPAEPIPPFRTLRERLALPRRPMVWRIEGWQQMGHRVVFSAQFKAGKTRTVSNVVRSILDGVPFLDKYEVSPVEGTVAVLDFEMAEDDPGQLDDWYRAMGIEEDDRAWIVGLRGRAARFDITDPTVRSQWARELRERGVSYLIVDCLRPILDAIGLDENREAGRFLVALDALLTEAGIHEALVVHHMGHQKPDAPTERARGDSRIVDWPDVNWTLVRESEDPASARFIKAYGRGVDVPEARLAFNAETGRFALAGGTRKEARTEASKANVLGVVLKVLTEANGWRNTQAVIDAAEKKAGSVRNALDELVRAGRAEKRDGERNAKEYRLAPPASQGAEA